MSVFLTPILKEEMSFESFKTWAARQVKGYSVGEVDHLARRAYNLKSHSDKLDLIERISDATKDASEKLAKEDDNTKKEMLRSHITVLNKIKSVATAYDPTQTHEENKAKDQKTVTID